MSIFVTCPQTSSSSSLAAASSPPQQKFCRFEASSRCPSPSSPHPPFWSSRERVTTQRTTSNSYTMKLTVPDLVSFQHERVAVCFQEPTQSARTCTSSWQGHAFVAQCPRVVFSSASASPTCGCRNNGSWDRAVPTWRAQLSSSDHNVRR